MSSLGSVLIELGRVMPPVVRETLRAPEPAAKDRLAEVLGHDIPADLAALLEWCDGQTPGSPGLSDDDQFRLLSVCEVVVELGHWSSGDYYDLVTPPGIPVMTNDSADWITLHDGRLLAWWHEDPEALEPYADSLLAWAQARLESYRADSGELPEPGAVRPPWTMTASQRASLQPATIALQLPADEELFMQQLADPLDAGIDSWDGTPKNLKTGIEDAGLYLGALSGTVTVTYQCGGSQDAVR